MYKREKGNAYEEYAAKYLVKNGHKILARNYSCRYGEIDIISKKDSYIIFHEVKFRSSNKFGTPAEAVTLSKQNKIRKTAQFYIANNNLQSYFRFDVITIDGVNNINVIENAF